MLGEPSDCCEAALAEVLRVIEEEGYTSKCRQLLTCILPKAARDRAEAVMKEDAVTLTVARGCGRSFWTVTTKNQEYLVFLDPGNHYCSCLSYANQVMKEGKFPFCKHVLAALIFSAMRKHGDCRELTVREVSDTEFTSFISKTATRITCTSTPKSKR